jgi:outer membrane receptor protein involved in Fe transport
LGVVLQPRFIPGLALTIDYYSIKIKDVIATPTFESIFDACFESGNALDPNCLAINRAPGTGSLWLSPAGFVAQPNQNFSDDGLESKGWDFQGSYNRRLGGWGTLNLAFVGTLLENSNGAGVGRPGSYAGLQPAPKWRHVARAGLTMPNGMGVSMRWRHFSGVNCEPAEGDPGCANAAGVLRPANLRLSARDYFDLSFTARIAQRLNLRLGSNNIFDVDPPVAGQQTVPAGFGNGNTFPQVYDSLGRYLFAGFTIDW